jgi:hypothetical protein
MQGKSTSTIWRKNNLEKSIETEKKYMGTEKNFILSTLRRPFKKSVMYPKKPNNNTSYTRKSWIPEITLDELYDELILHVDLMKNKFPESDGRLCRYCEKPWTYIRNYRKVGNRIVVKTNFSLDRFDSMQTYKKGNVVFCCNGCNTLKNGSTKEMWIKFLEIDKELNG